MKNEASAKTVRQAEEETRRRDRKKIILVVSIGAALIAAGVLAVVLLAGSGRATIKGTLEEYYATMYTSNGKGFTEMEDCYAPDIRTDWYNNMTTYGINFSQLSNWRLEAIEQVGDHVSLKVKVTETDSGSGADLANIRQTYGSAEAVSDIIFKLYLKGDTGSMVTHGVTELVKIGGKWYFTSTSVPMTVESREGSAHEWADAHPSTTTEGTGN